jgi:hypothetical protein
MAMGSHGSRPYRVGAYEYENVQLAPERGYAVSMTCGSIQAAGCHAMQESPSTPLVSVPM